METNDAGRRSIVGTIRSNGASDCEVVDGMADGRDSCRVGSLG